VARQKASKIGIEEIRVSWSATVMNQASDGFDVQFPHSGKSGISPAPVAKVRMIGRDRLPHDRVANRAYAEPCDRVEVRDASLMARFLKLIPEPVADPHHGAFETTP
jgi:hypothetical protein